MVFNYILQSLTKIYPGLHTEDYFSDTVLARIKLTDRACLRGRWSLRGPDHGRAMQEHQLAVSPGRSRLGQALQ